MKKIYILFFLFIFCCGFSFSQNPLVKQWDKRFGGTDDDELWSFHQTKDGGCILGGRSSSSIGGDKTQASQGLDDYWIVKIDSLGNKQWDKNFGGTDYEWMTSLQQTTDGGYILGGSSSSGISGDKTQACWGGWDYWIVKIDSLGNKQWDKRFGGDTTDILYSVQQTKDKGFILGGYSMSGNSGNKTQSSWGITDIWIVKIDSVGNQQWDKDFGGTDYDWLYSLEQTDDGGYILGGDSRSGISGNKTQVSKGYTDFWIIKIDSLGNKLWDRDFGGLSYDNLYSLKQTIDGGYILGGESMSGISGDKTQDTIGSWDYWIVKIDSLGNKQWDKDFGGTGDEEFSYSGMISQTKDDGYLISGTSYSPLSGSKTENNLGPEQAWIVKTDSLGNKQWDKTIFTPAPGDDEVGLAIQTNDGCYAVANYTHSGVGGYKTQSSRGGSDYWIIKFCDTTRVTENISSLIPDNDAGIKIYPNPAKDEFTIYGLNSNSSSAVEVYNVFGEKVYNALIEGGNKKQETINCKQFAPGIYFVKVANEKMNWVGKFVKE